MYIYHRTLVTPLMLSMYERISNIYHCRTSLHNDHDCIGRIGHYKRDFHEVGKIIARFHGLST